MTPQYSYLFLKNKYSKWYFNIINNRKRLPYDDYTENHHIIPECFGGPDDSWNRVKLTAREHLICHLLLTKMTVGADKRSMVWALHNMLYFHSKSHKRYIPSSKLYEIYRKLAAEETSKRMKGKNHPLYGKHRTEETKRKISEGNKGKVLSQKSIDKMKETKRLNPYTPTEEGKRKLSEASKRRKGVSMSERGKKNCSIGQRKRFDDPDKKKKAIEILYASCQKYFDEKRSKFSITIILNDNTQTFKTVQDFAAMFDIKDRNAYHLLKKYANTNNIVKRGALKDYLIFTTS